MRLTKKEKNKLASYDYRECDYLLNGTSRVKALNKLGQLEDIEEELGVDLIALFKALKQGYVWYDPTDPEKYEIECLYMEPQIHLYVADGVGCCYMDDYKKEWALTKDELEK